MLNDRRLRKLLDLHFAGIISPDEERLFRPHLPTCADCRAYYRRHLVLAHHDPDALSSKERIAIGLGISGRRSEPS
jgi:hypothetical protein